MSPEVSDWQYESMTTAELETVVEAELRCFPEDAWTFGMFADMMTMHGAMNRVLKRHGDLIGYLVSFIVLDEAHLANIAVLPEHRRRGIGRKFLAQWLDEIKQHGVQVAYLEVRQNNVPAIALYEAFGFEQVGIRPRYYSNGEDAVLMTLWLEDTQPTDRMDR